MNTKAITTIALSAAASVLAQVVYEFYVKPALERRQSGG